MKDAASYDLVEIREELRRWDHARTARLNNVAVLPEVGRWHGRNVTYVGGQWHELRQLLPQFATAEFQCDPYLLPNPYLRTVVRQPLGAEECPVPVAVVSNSYRLVQHQEVIEKCFEGLRWRQIEPDLLECEVGLTPLGEWMNFRTYLPYRKVWTYLPPDDPVPLRLRLECSNSVDGSSCLVIWLGWYRLICGNGLVLRGTRAEVRDVHDWRLDLQAIPDIVAQGLDRIPPELALLRQWEETAFTVEQLRDWIDNKLAKAWGKKAACRVYHICTRGVDVEYADAFAPGEPTRKPVRDIMWVLGAPRPSSNLFHVSQALSWVATRRAHGEERIEWQAQIPALLDELAGKRREPAQQSMFA